MSFLTWSSGSELLILSSQDFTQEVVKAVRVTCHRNTVLLTLHSEAWTGHVQASADAEEVEEDLKKQEFLTAWRCESLGKNMETHMPCFPKHLSSVTFSSSKGHIHSNRPHAWHKIDTLNILGIDQKMAVIKYLNPQEEKSSFEP